MAETAPVEFSPASVRKLRSDLSRQLAPLIPHAIEVIEGKRKWSAVQRMLFTALLAKIMPDLEAKYVQVDVTSRTLDQMSRAELEAIAQGIEP